MNQVNRGIYKHYKGKLYEVIGTARFSEDIQTEFVIYKQLYDSVSAEGIPLPKGTLWARPKEMFTEDIIFDGVKTARFAQL